MYWEMGAYLDTKGNTGTSTRFPIEEESNVNRLGLGYVLVHAQGGLTRVPDERRSAQP